MLLLLTSTLLASQALAAQPLLLPGAPLSAGEPGTVELWITDLSADTRVKARAGSAHVGTVQRLDDGRLRIPVTPAAAGQLALDLTMKGPAGKELATVLVPVEPAMTGGIEVKPAQPRFDHGRDRSVAFDLRALAEGRQPLAERRLIAHSSLGRLDEPQPDAAGWSMHWTPPKDLQAPAYAIVAVADAAAPSAMPGWAAFPVAVQTRVELKVDPGATCTLTAGEDQATATADQSGQLSFSLHLHPAIARGELACETGARAFHRAVSLPAGQHPWVGWLPVPARVPAGATIPLQVVIVEDDGAPRQSGTVPTVVVSAGSVSSLRLVGSGLAGGSWTAPTKPGAVRLTASLLGQEVHATVDVVADLPTTTAIAEPTLLAEGSRDVKIAVSGALPVAVSGEGVALRGRISGDEAGATATVRLASGRDTATATLVPALSTSALTAGSLVGWADTPTVPAGHRSAVTLTLAAVDDLGLPVPGVTLALTAEGGTASTSVRTDSRGLARVGFTPDTDGVGLVRATTAGLETAVPVLVGLAEGPLSDAPGTGPDRVRALRERLRAAVPTVVVARIGSSPGSAARHAPPPPLPSPAAASVHSAAQAAGQALSEQEATQARARPVRDERTAPWARFAVSAATVPHSYHQSSSGEEGLPEELDADQGDLFRGRVAGAPAVHLRAIIAPESSPVGFDGRLQGRYEGYVVNDTGFTRLDLQAALGLRLPVAVSERFAPYLLAQAEHYRVPLFTFDSFREENPDKATGARMLATSVFGARLGGGIGVPIGDVLIEAEATETLSPWPVHTRAEIGAEYAVSPLVGLRAGLELGFRSMTFDLETEEARVTDQQHALSLGMLFLLR